MCAFVGRTYFYQDGSERIEELLNQFIEMAIDPEDETAPEPLGSEEEYLSLFLAHTKNEETPREELVTPNAATGRPEISYSRFISNYSQLDTDSDIGFIRLSSAVIQPAGMSVYSPDATLLCYTLTGEGEIIINGKATRCRKYDCVWADCSKRIQYRASPGRAWECAFVRVQGRLRSGLFAKTCDHIRTKGILRLTFGAGTRFRSLIWQLLSERTADGPDPENIFSHLLLSLFLEVELAVAGQAAQQRIVPDIIVAIQSYLDKNYAKAISLDDLSHMFSISKFHMSREFKRYVGKSPNEYLIDVRLNKAKELLIDTTRTISDIGQLVGVPNTNHFLYLFKEREGITPSAFRKQRI